MLSYTDGNREGENRDSAVEGTMKVLTIKTEYNILNISSSRWLS